MTSQSQDLPGAPSVPLFGVWPRLARGLPRLPLGRWPTPVLEARRFAQAHGLASLHIKREDLSHPVCGGNKVRGLEFLLAEAERRGTRHLLTVAAAGSYHVVCSAFHAKPLGMCVTALVLPQPATPQVGNNLLRGVELGVEYVPAGYAAVLPLLMARWLRGWARRSRWHFLPPGGTSSLACVGHVNAAFELRAQVEAGLLPEPDFLFVALGSLGTAAGLALGLRLARFRTRVVGIVVANRWYATAARLAGLSRRTLRRLQRHEAAVPNAVVRASDVSVEATALGAGYGHRLPDADSLVAQMRALEGVILDSTYTAKAILGALRFIRRHGLQSRRHLFWHTCHAYERPADSRLGDRLPRRLRSYLVE